MSDTVTAQVRLQQAVRTSNVDGEDVGFRIVDMYHPGTAKWLQKHLWWATHNDCEVVINSPSEAEVNDYIEAMKLRLQQQFGGASSAALGGAPAEAN